MNSIYKSCFTQNYSKLQTYHTFVNINQLSVSVIVYTEKKCRHLGIGIGFGI